MTKIMTIKDLKKKYIESRRANRALKKIILMHEIELELNRRILTRFLEISNTNPISSLKIIELRRDTEELLSIH